MEQVLLQFFEGIRSPALTVVFGIFSALGEGLIVAGAVILVYWLAGQAGEQILFTLLSSAAANSLVKCVVQRPRPYAAGATEQLPSFFGKEYGDALSFPSGHTQASASALLAGAMRVRRAWMWILSLLLIALIACSRLYFGVHWPTDLLGGFLFGLAFALFWQLIFGHAYRLRPSWPSPSCSFFPKRTSWKRRLCSRAARCFSPSAPSSAAPCPHGLRGGCGGSPSGFCARARCLRCACSSPRGPLVLS